MLALTRVVMKPGDSLTRTVSFPIRRETSSIASSVAAELSSARTISISFILCTGLKKCIPATRAGAFNDPASSVMLSAEVFEAITASAGASRSMSAKSASFRSSRSGAASMTNGAPASASSRLVVVWRRVNMASASPAATLPSSTPFFTICSIAPRPLATAASDTSYILVSYPAAIAACAIPCPIVPAPSTATLRISIDAHCSSA